MLIIPRGTDNNAIILPPLDRSLPRHKLGDVSQPPQWLNQQLIVGHKISQILDRKQSYPHRQDQYSRPFNLTASSSECAGYRLVWPLLQPQSGDFPSYKHWHTNGLTLCGTDVPSRLWQDLQSPAGQLHELCFSTATLSSPAPPGIFGFSLQLWFQVHSGSASYFPSFLERTSPEPSWHFLFFK